jgi:hypothetical protein
MNDLTRVIARSVDKIARSAVVQEHWPRARARFKSEIAKLPLRANLDNVKIPRGTSPQAFFVQFLSRGQRTSREIMMDLIDLIIENKGGTIERTALGAMDKLQLYRLFKNLKCKGEMKAALNDHIQEMSRRPLNDKEIGLLIDLKSMRNALVDMESEVEDLLKQNGIEVSFDNAAVNEAERDRILDALEDAWDSVKQKTDLPSLELVKSALANRPVEGTTLIDSNLNIRDLDKLLYDDGYINPAVLRRTLVPALREAGEAHPEATAREVAAILSRKHDRLLLDDLYHRLIDPIPEQIKGTKGAGRDLLKAVAHIKATAGQGEEPRVPNLANAARSGGRGVWAAVHELASYAHSCKDFEAAVRDVLEAQKDTFTGEAANAFLNIARGYDFHNEARDVRTIMRDVYKSEA